MRVCVCEDVCVRVCAICRCHSSVFVGVEKGDKFREWG